MSKGRRPPDEGDIQEVREALGMVAVAGPEVYWLYAGKDGEWYMRREGDGNPPAWRSFATRAAALTAIRVAAARCTSYCLYLQDEDGQFVIEQSAAKDGPTS